MTENGDQVSEARNADDCDGKSAVQESVVSLKLPADLTEKLQQFSRQSGKSQGEIILAILKSAFAKMAPEALSYDPMTLKMQQELKLLKIRLTELETLMPRFAALEGKLMAF
jgi:hypothetical protein